MVVVAIVFALLFGAATAGDAQSSDAPSTRCWRFAFGAWTPPLDWERAGHHGSTGAMSDRIQRVRDSVFAKDTNAVRSSAMLWERTTRGWSLVLFPSWWPVGVKVDFDSVLAGDNEMTGEAVALVADASQEISRARARAVRCPG
jgi:hypothetical protein